MINFWIFYLLMASFFQISMVHFVVFMIHFLIISMINFVGIFMRLFSVINFLGFLQVFIVGYSVSISVVLTIALYFRHFWICVSAIIFKFLVVVAHEGSFCTSLWLLWDLIIKIFVSVVGVSITLIFFFPKSTVHMTLIMNDSLVLNVSRSISSTQHITRIWVSVCYSIIGNRILFWFPFTIYISLPECIMLIVMRSFPFLFSAMLKQAHGNSNNNKTDGDNKNPIQYRTANMWMLTNFILIIVVIAVLILGKGNKAGAETKYITALFCTCI